MKVINMGNIAEAYICSDLPTRGIVIEATLDELERLPNLVYREVTISAAPRRNCDVGTVAEQMKRQHDTMCNTTKACPDSDWSCKKCFAEWSQMPYEEGGAE